MLFFFLLHTGCLGSVISSSPQECDDSKWPLSKQTCRNVKALHDCTRVFLPLKTSEPSATATTPDPFCQPKRNADSYLVQKYPSSYARHFVFPRKVISFVLEWQQRWYSATFSSRQPRCPAERPVEIVSIATRTQSLVGSPPCANTADCVQRGGRAKTGSASALDRPWIRALAFPPVGPLAALIWFWDCFIFCVSVTKGSARRKAADSIRWWKIISERHADRFYKPPHRKEKTKQKPATCPVWIHPMWKQCREDNHFKRLN